MFRTENGASSSSRYHEQRTLTLLPLCGVLTHYPPLSFFLQPDSAGTGF